MRAKFELKASFGPQLDVEFFTACEVPREEVEHYLTRSARAAAARMRRVVEGRGPDAQVTITGWPTVYIASMDAGEVEWARGIVDRVQADFDDAVTAWGGTVTPWGGVTYDDRVSVRPRSWLARLIDRILRVDDVLDRIRRDDSVSPL